MGLTFHWFLPTFGDSRYLVGGNHGSDFTASSGDRPATHAYLAQIARSAEQLGYTAVLSPIGAWCEDPWITTASLIDATERLKFLVAFRPGQITPTLAAQMAGSFQRYSNGRVLLNIVSGGEDAEQRAYSDFLDKVGRYERTDEFLTVLRRLWAGERVDFAGEHIHVEGAQLAKPPSPVPDIYFSGSSTQALKIAAKHVDAYLTWGEPPAQVREKLAALRAETDATGRDPRLGIRLHVISRDTAEEAWAQAEKLLKAINPATIAAVQAGLSQSVSEGQKRMSALHGGRTDHLEVSPNLWAGVGLVRGGAGTALVGSHAEVAERIEEYHALGLDEFVLSGYPHLEEAYWFAEGVLPILRRKGLWRHPADLPAVDTRVPFANLGVPTAQ
ncbi:MAG TPA: LLM class flavin-dependent oxidoreductase [Pseudonocardiaceae bacterium]